MDLPTVLYRCPGSLSRAGGTYDYLGVETEAAYEAAVSSGWQLTMPDAIEAFEGKKAEIRAEVEKEMAKEEAEVPASPVPDVDVPVVEAAKPRAKPGPKPKTKA